MGRRPDQTPRSEQAASARPSTHRHRASLAIDRSIDRLPTEPGYRAERSAEGFPDVHERGPAGGAGLTPL